MSFTPETDYCPECKKYLEGYCPACSAKGCLEGCGYEQCNCGIAYEQDFLVADPEPAPAVVEKSNNQKLVEIFQEAHRIFTNPNVITRNTFARKRSENSFSKTVECQIEDPDACKFCFVGGISRASFNLGYWSPTDRRTDKVNTVRLHTILANALQTSGLIVPSYATVTEWSDEKGSQAKFRKVLNRAIELAERTFADLGN